MKHGVWAAVFILAMGVGAAWACGPYFPSCYLLYGNELDILLLPGGYSGADLSDILGAPSGYDEEEPPAYPFVDGSGSWHRIERADLEAALQAAGTADSALMIAYMEMRTELRRHIQHPAVSLPVTAPEETTEASAEATAPSAQPAPAPAPPATTPLAPFDLTPYEPLLARIPAEFALYVRGTAAYANVDWDGAVAQWRKLLELPADQRKFRSVWAAYMIGRTRLATDLKEADAALAQAVTLASEGFTDSWGLKVTALRWRVEIAQVNNDYLTAIHCAADICRVGNAREQCDAGRALWGLCYRVGQLETIPDSVLHDPVCRRLMSNGWSSVAWVKAMETLPESDRAEVAGPLAWAAYGRGDMELAEHWVNAAKTDDLYAQWVKSKLLLRDGKIDEAIPIIQHLSKSFPADVTVQVRRDMEDETVGYRAEAAAELGILLLGRKEYTAALDALLRSGYWMDAAYVAERVLSLDELKAYVDNHGNEPVLAAEPDWKDVPITLGRLRDLLARRLARQGKTQDALPYYSEENRAKAEAFIKMMKEARQKDLEPEHRAERLYEAARFLRENGLGICGTELSPDWQIFGGTLLPPAGLVGNRQKRKGADEVRSYWDSMRPDYAEQSAHVPLKEEAIRALSPTPDEIERDRINAPKHEKRFHYRYESASLMWQAARLLPDNDIRTARALYEGGKYLSSDDPAAADKFFKALVRRCRDLPIARAAEERKWFPPKFIEETAPPGGAR